MKRFKYIKRLLRKYKETNVLKEKIDSKSYHRTKKFIWTRCPCDFALACNPTRAF